MTHFVAILAPWEAGKWRVLIPDAPECEAIGDSPDGAVHAAVTKVRRRVRVNGDAPTALGIYSPLQPTERGCPAMTSTS
jgi:hypothetical protein